MSKKISISKKTIIAIAAFAIIPALGACDNSLTDPEVPQFDRVDLERQEPESNGGIHHYGVVY